MNPKGYVDITYLELAAELTRPAKEGSYTALQLQPGLRVLDVGCGPGTDTIAIAQIVGSAGGVVGIDFDTDMVSTANERARSAGVSDWVTHRVGDALALPFGNGEFDAARSERLFEHLQEPSIVLAEMVRVTKPGGRVVVLDTDWGTLSIDSAYTDLERRLARVHAEHRLNNGYSGRRLYRQFCQQGLNNITIEAFALVITNYGIARNIFILDTLEDEAIRLGIATENECLQWRMNLEQEQLMHSFYASVNMVLAAGQKPG